MLRGRSPTAVCVVVSDGGARLDPAGDVCGLPTGPAPSLLQERYGPDAAVAVIGPAGERGVPYASIVTCRHHPLPRLGLGAKNVKAGLDALGICLFAATPTRPLTLTRVGDLVKP